MMVHIFTKQEGNDFIESMSDAADCLDFAQTISERLGRAQLDFDVAVITESDGSVSQITDLQALIQLLTDQNV